MAYFPMMVNLEDKPVLVIGGGEEGRKKEEVLRQFGAVITLVSPEAEPEAVRMADRYLGREFRDEDIREADYAMVVAATDDRELNRRISILAGEKKIPVNVVDDAELCSFIFPCVIKDRDVVCAVSSGGKSPYVAQYLKKKILEVLPGKIGEVNDRMGVFREKVKAEIADTTERRRALRARLDELLEQMDIDG